jgi:hypothetical protein
MFKSFKHSSAIILLLAIVGYDSISLAETVRPSSLSIIYDYQNSRKNIGSQEQIHKMWMEVCPAFGNYFLIRKGLQESGVFTAVQCYLDRSSFDQVKSQSPWFLTIKDSESEIIAELNHKKFDTPLAKTVLPPSEHLLPLMRKEEFASVLAFDLIHQLPFAWVIDSRTIQNSSLTLDDSKNINSKKKPPLNSRIILYTLNLDGMTWRSTILATADLKAGKYILNKSIPEEMKFVFAHSARGPNTFSKPLGTLLKRELQEAQRSARSAQKQEELANTSSSHQESDQSDENEKEIWDPRRFVPGGFVGLKLGHQVSSGTGLNQTSNYIGLLFEKRGGFLSGLRYYYDKVPDNKKKITLSDGSQNETNMSFARHTLGYSFSFNIHRYLPLLTLDPKVGIWTLNARLPTQRNSENEIESVTEFNVGTTYSAALEIGLESHFQSLTIRGWHSRDIGYSPIESGSKITSSRFGGDLYFPISSTFFGSFNLRGIAFYFADGVSIEQGISADEEGRRFLKYSTGFGGLGVALSW